MPRGEWGVITGSVSNPQSTSRGSHYALHRYTEATVHPARPAPVSVPVHGIGSAFVKEGHLRYRRVSQSAVEQQVASRIGVTSRREERRLSGPPALLTPQGGEFARAVVGKDTGLEDSPGQLAGFASAPLENSHITRSPAELRQLQLHALSKEPLPEKPWSSPAKMSRSMGIMAARKILTPKKTGPSLKELTEFQKHQTPATTTKEAAVRLAEDLSRLQEISPKRTPADDVQIGQETETPDIRLTGGSPIHYGTDITSTDVRAGKRELQHGERRVRGTQIGWTPIDEGTLSPDTPHSPTAIAEHHMTPEPLRGFSPRRGLSPPPSSGDSSPPPPSPCS